MFNSAYKTVKLSGLRHTIRLQELNYLNTIRPPMHAVSVHYYYSYSFAKT